MVSTAPGHFSFLGSRRSQVQISTVGGGGCDASGRIRTTCLRHERLTPNQAKGDRFQNIYPKYSTRVQRTLTLRAKGPGQWTMKTQTDFKSALHWNSVFHFDMSLGPTKLSVQNCTTEPHRKALQNHSLSFLPAYTLKR